MHALKFSFHYGKLVKNQAESVLSRFYQLFSSSTAISNLQIFDIDLILIRLNLIRVLKCLKINVKKFNDWSVVEPSEA